MDTSKRAPSRPDSGFHRARGALVSTMSQPRIKLVGPRLPSQQLTPANTQIASADSQANQAAGQPDAGNRQSTAICKGAQEQPACHGIEVPSRKRGHRADMEQRISELSTDLLGKLDGLKVQLTNVSCDGALKSDLDTLARKVEAETTKFAGIADEVLEENVELKSHVAELRRFRDRYEKLLVDLVDSNVVELAEQLGPRWGEIMGLLKPVVSPTVVVGECGSSTSLSLLHQRKKSRTVDLHSC